MQGTSDTLEANTDKIVPHGLAQALHELWVECEFDSSIETDHDALPAFIKPRRHCSRDYKGPHTADFAKVASSIILKSAMDLHLHHATILNLDGDFDTELVEMRQRPIAGKIPEFNGAIRAVQVHERAT